MQTGCLTEVLFDQDCTLLTKSKNWTNGPIFNYRGFQTNEMLLIYSVPDIKSQRKRNRSENSRDQKLQPFFAIVKGLPKVPPSKFLMFAITKHFATLEGHCGSECATFIEKFLFEKF